MTLSWYIYLVDPSLLPFGCNIPPRCPVRNEDDILCTSKPVVTDEGASEDFVKKLYRIIFEKIRLLAGHTVHRILQAESNESKK